MKVIIAGGRGFSSYWAVCRAVKDSGFKITEVVSGGASGADALGERWARDNGVGLKPFIADWKKHGRAAGPKRNAQMAEYADALIAMPGGKGTANMISEAKKRGLKIYVAA